MVTRDSSLTSYRSDSQQPTPWAGYCRLGVGVLLTCGLAIVPVYIHSLTADLTSCDLPLSSALDTVDVLLQANPLWSKCLPISLGL